MHEVFTGFAIRKMIEYQKKITFQVLEYLVIKEMQNMQTADNTSFQCYSVLLAILVYENSQVHGSAWLEQ